MATVVVPDWIQRVRSAPATRRSRLRVAKALATATTELGVIAPDESPSELRATLIPGTSDADVAALARAGGPPVAILKVPATERAVEELRRQHETLTALRADRRLGDWVSVIPRTSLHAKDPEFSCEQAMPGVTAATALKRRPELAGAIACAGLAAIGPLHAATATMRAIDEMTLDDWLAGPIALLCTLHAKGPAPSAQRAAASRIDARLRTALAHRVTPLGCVHGDYAPSNVLVDEHANRVTGIIDWGQVRRDRPPVLDVALWVLALHAAHRRLPLGELVRQALRWSAWPTDDPVLGLAAPVVEQSNLDHRDVVTLCWLAHLADDLRNTTRFERSRWWWAANVDRVLGADS